MLAKVDDRLEEILGGPLLNKKTSKAAFSETQKMSLSQTVTVAASARTKLGKEAAGLDQDLRHIVGHANLLDNVMKDLRQAEREQQAWFNQSTPNVVKTNTRPALPHRQASQVKVTEVSVDDDDET